MVRCPPSGPDGQPLEIVGLDSSIIQNPRVWEASGHVSGFSDPMADCRACKARFRADDLIGVELIFPDVPEPNKRNFLICGVGTPEEVLETNTKKIQKLEGANGPYERPSSHHVFNELNEEGRAEFI